MKTIKKLMNTYVTTDSEGGQYSKKAVEQMLKEYGTIVVEECASTFRWEWDYPESPTAMEIVDPDTIKEVKDSIK